MSIFTGIRFLLGTIFFIIKIMSGVIPSFIIIGISVYAFPWWYAFIIAAICIAFSFGKPVTSDQYQEATGIPLKYSALFDLLSVVLFVIGIILLILSYLQISLL